MFVNRNSLRFIAYFFSVLLAYSCQQGNEITRQYDEQAGIDAVEFIKDGSPNVEKAKYTEGIDAVELANDDSNSVLQTADYVDCPPEGSAKTDRLKELNLLKNRIQLLPGNAYNSKITLASLLVPGDDTHRWNPNTYVKVKAYVKDVKVGGVETVNCKAKDKDLRDTHIDLTLEPNSFEKNKLVIAEITPRVRRIMAEKGLDWRTSSIRDQYLGRWVEIEGWLMFDSEHANMAENTRPGNDKNWRATAWEIHPVIGIKIADKH